MRCYLDDLEPKMLTIEEGAEVSYGVFFACHGRRHHHSSITIKKNAYIGMHSTIVSTREEGLIIGENAVVGAGSLVNKSIPEWEIWAGNPAHCIEKK